MDKGFNFRETAGYVTDGTDETYVLREAYPVTRNGITFGWDNLNVTPLNKNASNDRRLAGVAFANASGASHTFRADLPASGNYTVHLALGFPDGGGDASNTATVKDNTSTLATINYSAVTAQRFTDATEVMLTEVTWPTTEAGIDLAFSSTVFNLEMASATFWGLNHVRLVTTPVSGSGIVFNMQIG